MAIDRFDSRQSEYRGLLQQLFPNVPKQQLDLLLRSIDSDLTSPLRLDASAVADLIVTVKASVVSNADSGRQRSIPHILNSIPHFTSGTITFPSSNGGTIAVSPGSNLNLTLPVNNWTKALISLDSSGNLIVTLGNTNPVEANALVPGAVSNTLSIGYVSLFNNSGTVQNVQQNKIFQLVGGGSGSGSAQAGFAREVPLSAGNRSVVVSFPSALPGVNYVVTPTFVNLTDTDPQFQSITVTNKTTAGFTATWNAGLDTNNYLLGYIVPAVQEQVGEAGISIGVRSVTVPLPIALSNINYVVVANLVNIADADVQFQAVEATSKTTSSFTVSWNAITDTANYKLAYRIAAFQ